MFDQQGNVLAPFAQGRNGNGIDVQPVKEVGPKATCCNFSGQVLVGRGNYADVAFIGPAATDPFEFAFLQDMQEFGLGVLGKFTYLIEKQRTLVSQFKASLALLYSIGEGAFFMAEKFALNQADGYSPTIDHNKWLP